MQSIYPVYIIHILYSNELVASYTQEALKGVRKLAEFSRDLQY